MIRTQFMSRAASGLTGKGRSRLLSSTALTAAVLVIGFAGSAMAADRYFDGGDSLPDNVVDGGTGVWDLATTNWTNVTGSANSPWTNGDDAFFGTTGGTVTIGSAITVDDMYFTASGYNIVAGGGGSLSISAASEISVSTGDTATISAIVGGAGSTLDKIGAGTLVLSGANTYTGDTTISAGTIILSSAGGLGTTAGDTTIDIAATLIIDNGISTAEDLVLNGGTLAVQGGESGTSSGAISVTADSYLNAASGGTLTLSGPITGGAASDLLANGSGTVILSGSNGFAGKLTVQNGTVIASNNAALGSTTGETEVGSNGTLIIDGGVTTAENLILAGGTLGVQATETATASGAISLTADSTVNAGAGGSLTLSGVISGTAGNDLHKTGAGLVTLSGTNTFLGDVTVSGGTLALNGGAAIENTVAINIDTSGATLDVNANEEIGSLAGVAGTSVTLDTNRLTTGGNDDTTTFAGVISGTGGITKTGSGVFTLSGANTFTGDVIVNEGTLALSGGSAIENTVAVQLTVSGATLDLNANEEIGSLSGVLGTSVTLDSYRLTMGGNDATTTFAGVISGTGGITKTGSGVFTLSGANLFTGDVIVNEGTLALNGGAALEDSVAVDLTVSGAVLDVNANEEIGSLAGVAGTSVTLDANLTTGGNNDSTTFAGVISGTGDLTKEGTGAFTLSGANTYSGKTTVSAGTLIASNNAALGTTAGATEVESGATLIIDDGITLGEGLILDGGTLGVQTDESATQTGTVNLTADSTVDVQGTDGTLAISGVISGGAGFDLEKLGNGTLILSGANTYQGKTTITAGRIIASHNDTLGTNANANDETQVDAGGTLVLDNGVTTAEELILNGGTLGVEEGETATSTGAVSLLASSTINTDIDGTGAGVGGTLTLSGVISGAADLTKSGDGTLILTNVNTYSGTTFVNEGTLQNDGTMPGAVTVASAAIFNNNGIVGGLTTNNFGGSVNAGAGSSFAGVSNSGAFNVIGAGAAAGAFDNEDGLLDLGNQSFQVASLDNSGGGTIDLSNGVTGQVLTSLGGYAGGGTVDMEVDVGNASDADLIQYFGAGSGNTTINFNSLNANSQLAGADILVVQGGTGGGTFTAANLPANGGLIVYGFEQQGNDWYVTRDVNTDAPGSIASNIAIVQSTIGAVVNRPSSAFVTGLASAEAGHCGAGPWLRGTGGNATATGTTTGGGGTSTSEVGLNYAGLQFGLDMACFNTDGQGFDIAYGAIGGYNQGSTTQQLASNNSTTASDFAQGYGGVYISGHKGAVSFDLQARVDSTDFTFNNATISLDDAKLNTTRYSLGGSASYATSVSGLDVVPNVGFSASLTKSGSVAFGTGGQSLTPDDAVNLVGFAGGSIAKVFVVSNNTAAIVPFVSGNLYNDFAGPSTATFANPGADYSVDFESSNLGMFGELSLGVNYAKIFGEQDLRQMSATVRVDAKYSDTVTGVGVTAQVRGQF